MTVGVRRGKEERERERDKGLDFKQGQPADDIFSVSDSLSFSQKISGGMLL